MKEDWKSNIKSEDFYGKSFFEIFKNYPPEIILKGWWWKRFFPKWRKIKNVMNDIVANEYNKNPQGFVNTVINEMIDKEYLKKFPPIHIEGVDKIKNL